MTERGLTPRVPRPAVRLSRTLPVSTLSSVLTARAGIQASGSSLHLTHSSISIHTAPLPLFSAESECDQVKSTLAFLLFPWLISWPAHLSTSCPPFQPHRTPQCSPRQALRFPISVASRPFSLPWGPSCRLRCRLLYSFQGVSLARL